jgi:hypothetical protein
VRAVTVGRSQAARLHGERLDAGPAITVRDRRYGVGCSGLTAFRNWAAVWSR